MNLFGVGNKDEIKTNLGIKNDLTLSLRKSRVDIEPLLTSSFLTSPDCFGKQQTQQGQVHPLVCPFSTSSKFWQSYSKKTCPILGVKLVVK